MVLPGQLVLEMVGEQLLVETQQQTLVPAVAVVDMYPHLPEEPVAAEL